ncbi:hypothetical protein ElyMa_002238700 [Elysia marginata]|uniref:AGC-kinase C-terminal domain-containing protein n=1 Tax=Elysia marginata TaxID=1093978 RepID=A0AAV4FXM3_9GAST|nr:hypothetical protein ElyMa_002238700 [Elysia marginata]
MEQLKKGTLLTHGKTDFDFDDPLDSVPFQDIDYENYFRRLKTAPNDFRRLQTAPNGLEAAPNGLGAASLVEPMK